MKKRNAIHSDLLAARSNDGQNTGQLSRVKNIFIYIFIYIINNT